MVPTPRRRLLDAARKRLSRARQRALVHRLAHQQQQQHQHQHEDIEVDDFAEKLYGLQVRTGMTQSALKQLHELYFDSKYEQFKLFTCF
jgi:ribose 1,5-bisphosphokinase PhnN